MARTCAWCRCCSAMPTSRPRRSIRTWHANGCATSTNSITHAAKPAPLLFHRCPMSSKQKHISETPATQFLRKHGAAFSEHPYTYVEHGGTGESARQLGVEEHHVVKTLVMEDEQAKPLIVLMHGDCSVSTKNLARQTGRKSIQPCKPEVAQRHSGFLVGGTSPFGLRKAM